MFSNGDPDALICYQGKLIWIEVKVTGGKLSALQAEQMQRWQNAGALVILAVWNYERKVFKVYTSKKIWSAMALINVDKIEGTFKILKCDATEWAYHFNTGAL